MLKKHYKSIIKYSLLFIYFFLCLTVFYNISRNDLYANYGFSYALSIGEIPYNDFNLVIPLFSPFLYSIGLLFSKSIIVIYLEQSFLLCVLMYYLFKMIKNKAYLFLFFLTMPFPIIFSSTLFPGYNYLSFLLLIIIIYLELNHKSDYLIGFLLGLLIITKHTIGIILFLPTMYYLFKDRKKFIKRLLMTLVPILIFILYLLLTKSLYNFINLCFLGMFDFGKSNSYFSIFYLILMIVGIMYLIYRIIKDKKNIVNYYLLLFSSICLPLIDFYHVSYFLLGCIFILLYDYNKKINDKVYKYIVLITIFISLIYYYGVYKTYNIKFKNYHNFEFTFTNNYIDKNINTINNYLNKSNKRVIYLMRGSENYFYKINNDKRLDYYDLCNYGNYGYNGVEKIVSELENEHDVLIVLDNTLYGKNKGNQQYVEELALTTIKTSTKIKTINSYEIYYKE